MWEAHAVDATTQTKTGPEVSLRTCSFRNALKKRGSASFALGH